MKKAEIDEILMPGPPEEEEERQTRVKAGFWKKVRKNAARIPFMNDVVAAYYCALDPSTPTKVRGTLLAALAYFILPLDSIPDFLMGFGMTDDIAVLTAALSMVSNHITDAHKTAANLFLTDETSEHSDIDPDN